MKKRIISGLLSVLPLATVLSCSENTLQEPFNGAKWIGDSRTVLYSDYLAHFKISADIELADASKRASLLFGGNDPRLMDADFNIMGVENGKDESYIRVELDRADKTVNVYRTGYTREDVLGKVFASIAVPDSLLMNNPVRISVTARYSELNIEVEGTSIGKVDVGPLGHGGDYIAYPQLSDVGYMVEYGQKAKVSNIEVREVNKPNALLYSHKGMPSIDTDQMALFEPTHGCMPVLKREFGLKKEVQSAVLYATARGIYEVYINGSKVGDSFYNPGLSQYNKHHYYQIFNVKDMLSKGDNVMRVELGEGWWSGDQTYSGIRNYFGDQLAFLGCLEIHYTDGSAERIVTEPSKWMVSSSNPTLYASMFQGQVIDASLAYGDWTKAEEMLLDGHVSDLTFGATAPRVDDYRNWNLVPQQDASPSCFTVLTARNVEQVRPGVFVYDMGQNFAGIPSITLSGLQKGQQLRFRYSEVLYPDLEEYKGNEGMVMLENLRGAMVQDIYKASGSASELFEPHFTQHGYRYVEITGIDHALPLKDVKGLVISSVQNITAHYECSNPLVNRLWENIKWSMLANFISIPTDCPQRNERMGWSGDLSVFSRTATYMSDVDDFLLRHTQAIRDVQMPDGRMPDVAPIGGAFGGILWGSVGLTIPYECYCQYNDLNILEQNYEAMKQYMELVASKYIEEGTGLMTQGNRFFGGLGDWLGPQNKQVDNTAIWDAYYIFDLQIMIEAAQAIGNSDDVALYSQRLSERKNEFITRYFNPVNGRFIASGYPQTTEGQEIHIQSSYVLPLAFGIIDDEALRKKVVNNLVETIIKPGVSDNGINCPPYSLMTGFITTAWISKALSDNGRSDMAYRLLQATTYPSWLYPVTQGATSIWERLDSFTQERGFGGNNSMNSFNHYSFGAVGQWMMAYSLGIDRDPESPGFKHFILHPEAEPTGQMKWARGWYDTPYGRIESSWKREYGKVLYEFTIPEGCSATVCLPGAPSREYTSGHYMECIRS
ncbi:MAG: family 78 glycoside hydrolase catalytic domain [Candidatus Cryptobacteroides sp.]